MSFTKEQCDRDFREALENLQKNYGMERLCKADEIFDIDVILLRFLNKHPLAECCAIEERRMAIEECVSDIGYALKVDVLLDLMRVIRMILCYTIALYDRITQCEEFRDEVINLLWVKPLPAGQPARLVFRALIAAYEQARLVSDKPLPSSEELIGRQKIRETLSQQPGASVTRTETGFTCIVPGRRNQSSTN